MSDGQPFERLYNLGDLGRAGAIVSIALTERERERLADWAGVAAVQSFAAEISLTKHAASRFGVRAKLRAAIVQSCVVTLEPVNAGIEREFARELLLASPVKRALPKQVQPAGPEIDDEVSEEIQSLIYDLAIPLLEEFSLAIEPYPRAPGVAFEAPKDQDENTEGPFAALKALKSGK